MFPDGRTPEPESLMKSLLTPSVPKKAEDGSHCLRQGCGLGHVPHAHHGPDASQGHHCLDLINLTPQSSQVSRRTGYNRPDKSSGSGSVWETSRAGKRLEPTKSRDMWLRQQDSPVICAIRQKNRKNAWCSQSRTLFYVRPALPVEVPPSASSPPHHVPSRRRVAWNL